MASLLGALLGTLMGLLCGAVLLFWLRHPLIDRFTDRTLVRLLKDRYAENLWDLVVGIVRMTPQILMETELRAEAGHLLERPLGGIQRVPGFSGVAFSPAQLIPMPLSPDAPVDTTVQLGPRSRRPLRLEAPLMVAGMGYGVAVSRRFALALAKGANMAGVAYNTGSGPVLEELLASDGQLILQYTGDRWTQDPNRLRRADMIEIRIGHGGRAALGRKRRVIEIPDEARPLMELGHEATFQSGRPPVPAPGALRQLVAHLRTLGNGRPIAVKLAATHQLERELELLLNAEVDVIAIDGAEGGTHATPPVLGDDFGLPTVYALHRAVVFLDHMGARQSVSLVVSGGLRTPGEMLKALALGADAVYVGTAAMMAATHSQLSKAVPDEPVTQLVWANGIRAEEFDIDTGATSLARFLTACREEMAEACRALGHSSIRDLSRKDLMARDAVSADTLGLPPAWMMPPHSGGDDRPR